ncbi:MAG: hypothetical protein HFJ41_02490 [Clostridia bacterium]|nr:hypothetical protein [Clostridia bacterium]
MILDIRNKEHLPIINMYKKCKGITLVEKYLPKLSQLNKMYVIDCIEDWEKVEHEFPTDMMTVRCDCLEGINGKLPSGQTFSRNRVEEYIKEVKEKVPNAIIILEDMKKGSNERIHTQGGITLDIKIGDYIYIDYVGQGFDARELCEGKAVHESWNIPWEEVAFMEDTAIKKYKIAEVNTKEYIETAKERMQFLTNAFPDKKNEIVESMPKKYNGISMQIFRDVRDQVIFPLWIIHEQLLRDGLDNFVVEINIVEDGTLVPMEIAVSERFKIIDSIER